MVREGSKVTRQTSRWWQTMSHATHTSLRRQPTARGRHNIRCNRPSVSDVIVHTSSGWQKGESCQSGQSTCMPVHTDLEPESHEASGRRGASRRRPMQQSECEGVTSQSTHQAGGKTVNFANRASPHRFEARVARSQSTARGKPTTSDATGRE